MKIGKLIDLASRHLPNIMDLSRLQDLIPKRRVTAKKDRCVGCGACTRRIVCPVRAVSLYNHKVSIDHSRCLGCGHCVLACRRGALTIGFDPW